MTIKNKKFLTGTFLCVSTFSCLFDGNQAFALQDVAASQSTLQALLQSSDKRGTVSSLSETKAIKQVAFTDEEAQSPNALQPLLPKLPTPPKFRPTPLLPSIAQNSPVPIVSAPVASQSDTRGHDFGSQPSGSQASSQQKQGFVVPIVSGSSVPTPIVSAPLPQQPAEAKSFTFPAVPVRTQATVPVVNGQAVISSNSPSIQTKPMVPTIPVVETAAATTQSLVETKSEVSNSLATAKTEIAAAAKSATQEFVAPSPKTAEPIVSAPVTETSNKQTIEQAIVEAQAEIAGDEIKVEEISSDQLMSMILGKGIKAQPVSAAKPKTTQERVATIGSGTTVETEPAADTTVMNLTTTQEVFSGAAPSYMDAPCDTGYGCDARRPEMPSCLPYDGCGCVTGATGYAFVDYLYMDRDKGDFSASFLPANDQYDYTSGARFRFGRKYDSIEGWEAGFTILDAHTSNTQIFSPTNSLSPRLFPTNGFNLASISSFNGASFHESFQKSHFYSGELNKMSWNWDVMSTFIGFRYTSIDDMYGFNTIGAGGDFGTYRLRARNHLFGPQIGGELFYDIGRRLSFSVSGKLGGYVNFYQTNTEYANNNLRLLDNTDEDVDFSWSTELGVFARYMISPRAKLKVGYEFWFFDNVASAQGQYNGLITPFSGLNSSNSDDALYHGASFGLEWYR